MIKPRFTANPTWELLYNVIWNDKPKTNTLRVHPSRILQLPKESKQLNSILSFDTYSRVLDLDHQLISGSMSSWYRLNSMFLVELPLLRIGAAFLSALGIQSAWGEALKLFDWLTLPITGNKLCTYFYLASSFGKLERVTLQIHQNLFDSHGVSFNHVVEILTVLSLWKTSEAGYHLHVLWVSFVLLYLDYFFDSFLDVKFLDYFIELVSFDLSISQNVFNVHK